MEKKETHSYKNQVKEKIAQWLLNIFDEKDVQRLTTGVSAPFVTVIISHNKEMINIIHFNNAGKSYNSWYFMPNSFESFSQRLNFNQEKLLQGNFN